MDISLLKKFGMTSTEAKIYLQIIKFDETKIGPIIKMANLHRGTVYNSINNLIKKGFVGFIDRENARYYKSQGEKIFKSIILEKERKLIEGKKSIQKFFKNISKSQKGIEKQEVNVFCGVEIFKTLFLEMCNECKKNNIEYIYVGRGGDTYDMVGKGFYEYVQKIKQKLKIKCRMILDKETVPHPYHKYVMGNRKYLRSKLQTPVNFWIYGDHVLFVLFDIKPLLIIKIKSNSLADSFKGYFEVLWKSARKCYDKKINF
jgi:sugar-specific transcriptional regulator TrmB